MAKKFGARKGSKYKVACIAPSVNLTQVGNAIVPIPYKVQQKLSSGKKVPNKGGVKSGTVEAKSESLVTTPSARIYKQQLIRVKDLQYMQSKNTLGKVQSSESGSAPEIKDNGEIEETEKAVPQRAILQGHIWLPRSVVTNQSFSGQVRYTTTGCMSAW
jgi:hypothetical protein